MPFTSKKGIWTIVIVISFLAICAYTVYDQKETKSFLDWELLDNEKKAIQICKNATPPIDIENVWQYLELSARGLSSNATWLDVANMLSRQNPNQKYDWSAEKTAEQAVYLVTFANEDGRGQIWEVNIKQETVKHLNTNEYLFRKHGFSMLDIDSDFAILEYSIVDTLKHEKKYNHSKNKATNVVYDLKGSIRSYSDKTLTNASITGKLQVIFKDKTLESSQNWQSGFTRKISASNPWKYDELLDFQIKTEDIDEIYLNYDPEYVFFTVDITVQDPIGYSYSGTIAEFDLKREWENLRKK